MQFIYSFTLLTALVPAATALIIALLLIATQGWHGHHTMDLAYGIQKSHLKPTLRVGGIAIMAAITVGYFFLEGNQKSLMGSLLLASVPAFAFGLLEDITKEVGVRARLLATIGSGFLACFMTGYGITHTNVWGLDWLLGFSVISIIFTAFSVSGIANAINIIDGFNGLSCGTVLIIFAAFFTLANILDDYDLAVICLILGSSIFGFLLLNWPYGKIFLGDGGAYLIGFSVAWVAVLLLYRHPEVSAWTPLLICAYPVLEVLFSILRRSRRNLSPSSPDRMHLHSLVNRRLMARLLPHASKLTRNSATGSLMWVAALIPVLIALQWPSNTFMLMVGFLICAALYLAVYARLTQFRWCFSPRTLIPQVA